MADQGCAYDQFTPRSTSGPVADGFGNIGGNSDPVLPKLVTITRVAARVLNTTTGRLQMGLQFLDEGRIVTDKYASEGGVRGGTGVILEIYLLGVMEIEIPNEQLGTTESTIVMHPQDVEFVSRYEPVEHQDATDSDAGEGSGHDGSV